MITPEQIDAFETRGAVTIDTGISEAELAAAEEVFDRRLPFTEPAEGETPRYLVADSDLIDEPALLDIIQKPFFEEVACRVLQTDAVEFFQTTNFKTYPTPEAEYSFDQHVDIQYCTSHLTAVPRYMICSFFFWLTDVNERRAPMMFRPGSHRLIGAHREKDDSLKNGDPAVGGVALDRLPALGYADPEPVLARRGQVSVLTTGAVHGGSINVDTEPRKVMIITFHPKGVVIDLPENQAAARIRAHEELRNLFREERRHLLMEIES